MDVEIEIYVYVCDYPFILTIIIYIFADWAEIN